MAQERHMILNMGPHHPSTHGVLRLVLELEGETVIKATPDIGYLHRGIEKLAETKTYHQVIPLTDRLDYISAFSNNYGYIHAVEKLLDLKIPEKAEFIRVFFLELTRISSHLLWLATHALDLGAMTMFWYTFREKELIYDFFEEASGARLTPSFFRIGGVAKELPSGLINKVYEFTKTFNEKVDEYEALLTKNQIWIERTKDVGVVSAEDAINYGFSGPPLRGSGVKWDVRKAIPYCGYEKFDFEVPIGKNGDVYDRYLIRLEEMRQSNRIIEQVIKGMPEGPILADAPKIVLPPKEKVLNEMEALIHHFLIISDGFKPPVGEVYASIEAPKGELGFYIISDGSNKPYRVRVRPPSFVNLQGLPMMVEGGLIADVTACIGTIDIVLGEVDR